MLRFAVTTVLLAISLTTPAPAQRPAAAVSDTMPAAVVQRFVDAFNARDARAMAALVAPAATVTRFPGGGVMMQGRDSIQAFYARRFAASPAAMYVTVDPRVVEGRLVVDQEHFIRSPGVQGRSTWMYEVRNGLIQRAWMLDGSPPPAR
jgi:uncharacterized protein (TIGR02246 family)